MAEKDNSITFTVDGREVTVPKGTTVLAAAKSIGIEIPTFCWHPKLKSVGACRMCYVEIEKRPKLEVSCATEALPGMVVHTDSEKVKQGRKAIIEFILLNHPLDCPTCDKGGECDLQNLTFAHGMDDSRFDFKKYRYIRDRKSTFDDFRIGPEIIRNQNRCILCFKCVRANKETFGEFDLGAFQRGNVTEIDAVPGQQVDSLYSGNLVEICPVGALTNTDWRYKIRVWNTRTVDSICPYCADGCNIKLWRGRERIFRATSRRNDAVDEGWICDVGRYGYQVANPEGRLTTPLIKKGDTQIPATWEEAIGLVAERFKEIKDEKGGVCIGGLIVPTLDSLSMLAFSKLFRTVLQSNNVDYRIDYRMLPEKCSDPYTRMTALDFRISDIEKSDLIIVIGSALNKEHPIVDLRVRKAVTKLGAKLYTMNPYATKSGDISTDEMIYTMGTLEVLINGLCLSLVEQGLVTSDGDLKTLLEPNTVSKSSRICGLSAERINALALAISRARNISLIVGDLVASSSSREKIATSIGNLIVLSSIAEKGQVGFLSKYSNSKGAEKLGVMPFPREGIIKKMTELWGDFPDSEGLAADRMILSADREEILSLLVMGANPIAFYPDGQFIRQSLRKLNFLVVADLYETETTAMADVVLPLASWAEYDGSLVNLEGRIQTFVAATRLRGYALPGYEIIRKMATELKAQAFGSVDELNSELTALLGHKTPADTVKQLHEVRFVPEDINPKYPIPLFIVDELHHFGHLTEKTKSLIAFCGECFLEISPAMAEKLKASDGTMVRIDSEIDKIVLPVKISKFIDNEVVLVPRNFSITAVNALLMRKRRIDRVKLSRLEEE